MDTWIIDSLMNGHLEPSTNIKNAIPVGASGKSNPYLEDPELGLELCANFVTKPDLTTEVANKEKALKEYSDILNMVEEDKRLLNS